MSKKRNWNKYRDGFVWGAGIATAAVVVSGTVALISGGIEQVRRRRAAAAPG